MKESGQSKETIPEYIKEQANHSWQMELFISLGMIFTLTKIPSILSKEYHNSLINIDLDSLTVLVFFGLIALSRVLLIGFAANLFLRAIWLGILGIYYVYPRGIDYDKLNYSDFFWNKYNSKHSTLDKVQKLERYSSLAFSVGIISGLQCLGILLTMGLLFFITLRVFYVGMLNDTTGSYVVLFFLVLFVIGIFDRFIFGTLKNVKWLNKLYWPIHNFLNLITLNKFIQTEKLTVASNSGRWKTTLLSFFYIVFAVIIAANDLGMADTLGLRNYSGLDSRKFMNVPGQRLYLQNDEYDDLLKETDIVKMASIPSEIIESNYLSVFVTFDKDLDENFEFRSPSKGLFKNFNELKTNAEFRSNSVKMRAMVNNSLIVKLDEIVYDSLMWFIRDHSITKQRGFQASIDISELENGRHDLIVKPTLMRENNQIDTVGGRWIPFIKNDR